MTSISSSLVLDPPRLEEAKSARLVTIGRAVGIAGLGIMAAAAVFDRERFGFSYLAGFMFVLTIALGGLFFVMLQHLTRAGWSVAPRRQMEWVASALPIMVVMFVPVALLSHGIYHHWMGAEAAEDALLREKAPYLNPGFFYIRAAFYLVVWTLLALVFTRASRVQDTNGDRELTRKMQIWSAPGMPLFALTLTFASFDWLMSLDPHWYSTIFGVYVFAGAVTSSLSVLALLTIALQGAGILRTVSTVEHRHDIGKLLFGFTVFYAYIAFSQYFLIWYANIPEETVWFLHRWTGSWKPVSLALVACQFVLPFVLLLPRAGKRSKVVLAIAASVLLVGHYLDMYWLVMPTILPHGAHLSWIDLAALAGPVGVMLWWLGERAARDRLYPVRDPRLSEAVRLENF